MSADRVLIVGTTADYIEYLHRNYPGRCLFLTDPAERAAALEAPPDPASEVVSPLDRGALAAHAVARHLAERRQRLRGIVSFDCESMLLAADLALLFGLRYPSPAAVLVARNKHAAKLRWQRAGLPCPASALVRSAADAAAFVRRVGTPVVVKPLTGSGGELVFVCGDETASMDAVRMLQSRLSMHSSSRMFAPFQDGDATIDPRQAFVVEEHIDGPELSCDFIVDDGSVEIIRCARKIRLAGQPAGTISGYVVPAELPEGIAEGQLEQQLAAAAVALGIERAICMVDFIVRDGRAVMLELTPRPGGDCLPPLIRMSCGLDMLHLALRFAAGDRPAVPHRSGWRRLVGLRLFSDRAGRIERIDVDRLAADPRVLKVELLRRRGDLVTLPPDDYDSRLLGHAYFEPRSADDVEGECVELLQELALETEEEECRAPQWA